MASDADPTSPELLTIDATDLTVDLVPRARLGEWLAPWRELLARALEPNVLHGPDVLVPALDTFAPEARVLVVCRGRGADTSLVGLVPLWRPRLGFGLFGRLPTVFSNEFAPLGTPLFDADRPQETVAALFAAAAKLESGLVFGHLALDGPVAALLRAVAAHRGDRVLLPEQHRRAALDKTSGHVDPEERLNAGLRRRRRREWRRQWRRLLETGPIDTASVRGPAARQAFADFLVLEASGWKGRRGTALVQTPDELRFGERIVDALADHDGVVIDRIDRAGQPLAMIVNFGASGRYVTWKTAYDEAFSAFSPGAQAFLRASGRFLGDADVVSVDSLAVADHPLLSHMWRDTLEIGTLVIAFAGPRGAALRPRAVARDIALHHRLRAVARRLRDRWFP